MFSCRSREPRHKPDRAPQQKIRPFFAGRQSFLSRTSHGWEQRVDDVGKGAPVSLNTALHSELAVGQITPRSKNKALKCIHLLCSFGELAFGHIVRRMVSYTRHARRRLFERENGHTCTSRRSTVVQENSNLTYPYSRGVRSTRSALLFRQTAILLYVPVTRSPLTRNLFPKRKLITRYL